MALCSRGAALSPITHALASWVLAETVPSLTRRDRALVVVAGVIPDLDGLGAIAEMATWNSDHPLLWFSEYHHALHNLGFFLLVAAAVCLLARGRWATLLLSALAFHLHLLCDIAGGRGPDGSQWPVPYLSPLPASPQLAWGGQWALNAWQNVLLTVLLLAATLALAWRRGRSPVGLFSPKADAAFVGALRRRFPRRAAPGG
jgi:inner membrane protein